MTSLWRELRLARTIHRWERKALRRKKLTISQGVLVGIFFVLALLGVAGFTVGPLVSMAGEPPMQMDGFIMFASLLAGSFILYLQLMLMYNRIFLADTEILLLAPVRTRVVLYARAYATFLSSFVYVALGLPLVVTYGILRYAGFMYYPLAVLSLVIAVWAVLSFGLLLVLLLMYVLRRRASKDVLAVLSSLVAILFMLVPRLLSDAGSGGDYSVWLQPVWNAVPLMWFGRCITSFTVSAWTGCVYLGFLLALLAVCGWLSTRIADTSMHERMSRMKSQEGLRLRRSAAGRRPKTGSMQATRVQGLWREALAVFRKDLARLRRSPAELANYLFPTAYLLFFGFQSGHAGTLGLIPVFLLILTSTMGRVPISAFGFEAEQFWLYLQAPVSERGVLIGKSIYGTLPTLLWWWLLDVLLAVLGRLQPSVAVMMAMAGLWMIPGAVFLTLPWAIRGAAFKSRRVGRQNVYVTRTASWYLLIVFPYLLLQAIPLGFACLPLIAGMPRLLAHVVISNDVVQAIAGQLISLGIAAIACSMGWHQAVKAWHNRIKTVLESGALD